MTNVFSFYRQWLKLFSRIKPMPAVAVCEVPGQDSNPKLRALAVVASLVLVRRAALSVDKLEVHHSDNRRHVYRYVATSWCTLLSIGYQLGLDLLKIWVKFNNTGLLVTRSCNWLPLPVTKSYIKIKLSILVSPFLLLNQPMVLLCFIDVFLPGQRSWFVGLITSRRAARRLLFDGKAEYIPMTASDQLLSSKIYSCMNLPGGSIMKVYLSVVGVVGI